MGAGPGCRLLLDWEPSNLSSTSHKSGGWRSSDRANSGDSHVMDSRGRKWKFIPWQPATGCRYGKGEKLNRSVSVARMADPHRMEMRAEGRWNPELHTKRSNVRAAESPEQRLYKNVNCLLLTQSRLKMKGQRVTGKVLLLQIQGDAQSLLRFLSGSGWEASSGAANNFPATALSYLYTRSEGFGDEGKRSGGF